MAKAVEIPAGATRITETKERIIPAVEEIPRSERAHVDPWSYMERTKPEQWGPGRHLAYLYRMRDGQKDGSYIECFEQPFTMEDVRKTFGGGHFRLMLKNGSEYLATENFEIEGNSRIRTDTTAPAGTPIVPDGVNSQLVALFERLIERIAEKKTENPLVQAAAGDALAIQKEGFINAMATMRETFTRPSADPMMDLFKPIIVGMMTKMLEPQAPVNALTQVQQMAELIKAVQTMNPAAVAGGAADWRSLAVSVLPQVIQSVERTSANYLHAMQISKGMPTRPVAHAPATPLPAAAAPVNPPPAAAPAGNPGEPNMEQAFTAVSLLGIVNILNDETLSVKDAAEKALDVLDCINPAFVQQIVAVGASQATSYVLQHPALTAKARERAPQVVAEFIRIAMLPPETPAAATTQA